MQSSWKPLDEELRETKKILKKEEDMAIDEVKKEGFQFGSVVFKTKDVKGEVIKQEKPSLPSLLTLASGIDKITKKSFKL